MIWNGIDVGVHGPHQTISGLTPAVANWYTGYDAILVRPSDLGVPEIPLEVRYESFRRRLSKAIEKHG